MTVPANPQPKIHGAAGSAPAAGLDEPRVKAVLAQLHNQAKRDIFLLAPLIPTLLFARWKGTPLETVVRPFAARGYFAIFPTVGKLLYLTARAIDARQAVEFGTSFGISSVYLAAAMRDNGGRFVGSDIDSNKVVVARRNLDEAGLSVFSEVREGDALETFRDLPAPVDLVLLDGWKDLYLPMLELLKPKLRKGSVVVADNIRHPFFVRKTMAQYVAHMQDPANGFRSTTLPLGSGIEYSVFEGVGRVTQVPGG